LQNSSNYKKENKVGAAFFFSFSPFSVTRKEIASLHGRGSGDLMFPPFQLLSNYDENDVSSNKCENDAPS
jgi:hypothetical protein